MHPRRLTVVVLAVIGLLVPLSVAARADSPPPAFVRSHFETDVPGNTIDRDGGFSAPIPGTRNSFWLFGDSVWTGGYWFGTTAAAGPYTAGQVPTGLTEVPTPPAAMSAPSSRAPQGFLPGFPSGLLKPDGTACVNGPGSIPASWPTGVAAIPGTSRLLITYNDVCQTSTATIERYNVAEYNPATNALSGITQVFTNTAGLPFQQILGSPIFNGTAPDNYVYLFGSICDGPDSGVCTSGRVVLARARASSSQWRQAGSYEFWTGGAWSDDPADAGSILPSARPAGHVYAGDFRSVGKGFVIVEQNTLFGDYTIWRSNSLTSGWTATRTGRAPCSGGSEVGLNFCRAYIGHPELSTTSNLLMSYYNPADRHISTMAIPW